MTRELPNDAVGDALSNGDLAGLFAQTHTFADTAQYLYADEDVHLRLRYAVVAGGLAGERNVRAAGVDVERIMSWANTPPRLMIRVTRPIRTSWNALTARGRRGACARGLGNNAISKPYPMR